ncbi:MAG: hypothetical protein H6825_16925 [Planctomycetes bacterium]|nr:hypothetical protein [Planctomycetota bacterium]
MSTERPKNDRLELPIAAPQRKPATAPQDDCLDLHFEEIEDKHVPKDRNIFDK